MQKKLNKLLSSRNKYLEKIDTGMKEYAQKQRKHCQLNLQEGDVRLVYALNSL